MCGASASCGAFEASSDAPALDDGGGEAAESSTVDATVDAPVDQESDALANDGDVSDAASGCEGHAFGAPVELTTFGEVTSVRVKPDPSASGAFFSYLVGPDAAGSPDDEDIAEGVFPKAMSDLYFRAVISPDIDTSPAPSTDDLHLVLEHGSPGARQVVVGSRAQSGQDFTSLTPLVLGTGSAQTREPWTLGDGSVLYFTAEPGERGGRDVYRAVLSAGAWTSAIVEGVSTAADEGYAVVSSNELTIFWRHAASGAGAPGAVWTATRAATGDAFGAGAPVPGLAGTTGGGAPSDDRPTWLSPDRCTLFFVSNRSGSYRAYSTTRP